MGDLTPQEVVFIESQYEEILKACARCRTDENRELIRKAFDLANEAHSKMRRRSGEPYIIHPIEVAKIVAQEIGLGTKSVVCSLLHDTVEDTDYTIEDIERLFGSKISSIIDGLTKISGVFDQNSSLQAENFRKMLMTLSDDVRVILIKLADRLHNMRTLDSMPYRKQVKIASETSFLYAPLAHRLGLYAIKTELEDLSLKYQQGEVYNEIRQKLLEGEIERHNYINKFSLPILEKLIKQDIKFTIIGRPKSIYSIYDKMRTKQVSFEEVYDLFAIRIIFSADEKISEKNQCWHIYSVVTDIYRPNPDRLRDWISTPKANGYEALHSTVMGPDGRWVEVQIRSERMDEIGEKGYAAHWKYKGNNSESSQLDEWIGKIKELLENPESNALEFLDEFKLNLFTSEIFIFTPNGQLRRLPVGATALDFAYEIHSEIGNKAIGAKINHKLQPLSYVLNSGDQVEILTSEKQNPVRDWINFVTTAKAKSKIRDAFKLERKRHIEKGKIVLEYKLKEIKLHPNSMIFKKLLEGYEVITKDELYEKIGSGVILLDNIAEISKIKQKNKWIRYWQIQFNKSSSKKKKSVEKEEKIKIDKKQLVILRDGEDESNYTISKCCNPIPGDNVVGFLENNDHINIHKTTCPNAVKFMSSHGDDIVTAVWTSHKVLSHLAKIKLNGIDVQGLVNTITKVISEDLDVNMKTIYFNASNGIFEGYIDLYIFDTSDLDKLISNLKRIKGIKTVTREMEF